MGRNELALTGPASVEALANTCREHGKLLYPILPVAHLQHGSVFTVEALLANRGVLLLEPQWLAFLAHNVPSSPSRIAIKPDQDQQEAG